MRVVFTGAHSTGKSTLVRAVRIWLSEQHGREVPVVNEVARSALRDGHPVNRESDLGTYLALFRRHSEAEFALLGEPIAVLDRCMVDYLAYARVHGNCPVDLIEIGRLLALALWDPSDCLLFYLPVEFPLVEDGSRDPDRTYQASVDSEIRMVMADLGFQHIELSGSVPERLERVVASIHRFSEGHRDAQAE